MTICLSDLRAVAQALGARLKRVGTCEWAGPCPICGGRDRFSVNIRKQVWNCRGCGVGGDDIALVRHVLHLDFRGAVKWLGGDVTVPPCKTIPAPPLTPEPDCNKTDAAVTMWRAACDPLGTLAQRYLSARGLDLDQDLAGEALRWHSGAGAMLALFRNVWTGEPQAISRTYLDVEARKLSRKFLGPVGGAAVMLDSFDAVTHDLHLAEGVETAIAARMLGLRPAWALGSKGAIGAFPVLRGIEALTILAEPDANKETEACATRWHSAGREVFINRSLVGKDLADYFKGNAA